VTSAAVAILINHKFENEFYVFIRETIESIPLAPKTMMVIFGIILQLSDIRKHLRYAFWEEVSSNGFSLLVSFFKK
jgi:hypothetical protein